MLQENVEWFGDFTPGLAISVHSKSDLNQDSAVNSADFQILKSSWNSLAKPPADLN